MSGAIGVNLDGERDVLGIWLGPTAGDGSKQSMTMLAALRKRGVLDSLIVCCDGLKGSPTRCAGVAGSDRANLPASTC